MLAGKLKMCIGVGFEMSSTLAKIRYLGIYSK